MTESDYEFETTARVEYLVWCEACDDHTYFEHDPSGEIIECDLCQARIYVRETL